MNSGNAPVFNTMPEYDQQPAYFGQSPSGPEPEPCLTEDEIMDAVAAYVSQHCCYGSGPVKEMKIKDIQSTPIQLYVLDLFLEERKAEWKTEPYRGEYLDSRPQYNTPVDIWSVHVPPPVRFGPGNQTLEVPGTLSVVNCVQCSGIGSIQCGNCSGSTLISCVPCLGTGAVEVRDVDTRETSRVRCVPCGGAGRVGCRHCKKKGLTPCTSCMGFRRVKNSQVLEINWSTSVKDCATKHGNVKIRTSMLEGLERSLVAEAFGSSSSQLNSFNSFRPVLDSEIGRVGRLPSIRVLDTRQRIFSYPGTEVVFHWKGRDEAFLVYGRDKRVYFPKDYPQNCCWVCTIL